MMDKYFQNEKEHKITAEDFINTIFAPKDEDYKELRRWIFSVDYDRKASYWQDIKDNLNYEEEDGKIY